MIRDARSAVLTITAILVFGACTQTSSPTVLPVTVPTVAPRTGGQATPATPTSVPSVVASDAAQTPSGTVPAASPSAASPSAGASSTASPTSGSPSAAGWRAHQPTDGPSAREDHTWTVDGDGAVAYLFGGRGADGALNDLWAFDLAAATWSQPQLAGDAVPRPRFGHTATWVPDVGLVVWSGQGDAGFFGDMWAYDPAANAWRELPSTGAVPPARYGSCSSLGPDGELWISHGFTADSGRFADTRSYNFTTGEWTDRTAADRVPVERCLHDCYWSTTSQFVLYAGQTTGVAALGDVWAYDLASQTWTRGPDPDAPARQLFALAGDGRAQLVFGGGALDGGYLGDTWLLDSATLELTPIEAAGDGPSARSGATVVLDAARNSYWLFGGQNSDGLLDDMWVMSAPSV